MSPIIGSGFHHFEFEDLEELFAVLKSISQIVPIIHIKTVATTIIFISSFMI